MRKIAIFASGSGTNAENIIKYFADSQDIKVVLVVSNNPKAGVHARANQLSIPSVTFTNEEFVDGRKVLKKLSKYQVDWIVLAGFLRKISPALLKAYSDKIINIHPALLPKYGGKGMYGMRVHEAVVAAGDRESGITIHYVNENYDEGKIIFQTSCPVLPTDTPEEVASKVHVLEYTHYPQVIKSTVNKNRRSNSFGHYCSLIFFIATQTYDLKDDANKPSNNPFQKQTIEFYLYEKSWIDGVQWHLENLIRDPEIEPNKALTLKRRIDKANQYRTDLVEQIDSYILDKFQNVRTRPDATINTESPGWAIDRLSILTHKIEHMQLEAIRKDATPEHRKMCKDKLTILLEQQKDLVTAIDQLLKDILIGKKYMKVYKQMKMYNDPSLNPVLYRHKKKP